MTNHEFSAYDCKMWKLLGNSISNAHTCMVFHRYGFVDAPRTGKNTSVHVCVSNVNNLNSSLKEIKQKIQISWTSMTSHSPLNPFYDEIPLYKNHIQTALKSRPCGFPNVFSGCKLCERFFHNDYIYVVHHYESNDAFSIDIQL